MIKALNALNLMLSKKKATVHELQQLSGFLNFLSRALFPGRAFTRRMYAKFSGNNLKQHHHVRLDQEFKQDCMVWKSFLNGELRQVAMRPFVDFKEDLEATTLEFFSDASLNVKFGVGARFNRELIFGQRPADFVSTKNPSIQYVELLGLTLAIFTWAKKLANRRVVVFVENTTVHEMVNHTATGGVNCMFLIRKIVLKCLQYNFRIFASYIKSEENKVADSLSRLDFQRFWKLARKLKLKLFPERLPEELWPVDKIWIHDKC